MQDTFQWTPELWCEFLNGLPVMPPSFAANAEQFKSSKAPKKEWEIVEVKNEYGHIENYHHFNEGVVEDKITKGKLTIHAVRRLSDDIIFSCQEEVDTPSDGRRVIEGFEIDGLDLLVKMGRGFIGFSAIRKLRAPVLTTVDGVEVTDFNNFFPTVLFEDGSMNVNCERSTWENDYAKANGKLFSTREAAEKYVLDNSVALSLNDVKEAFQRYTPSNKEYFWARLTAIIKERLNQ